MDIYKKLGVKTYINAYDTMTMYGSTIMDDEVLQSYKDSASVLVDMNELQDVLGKKIAEMTHNEAAYITTGASMGITLSVCACMAEGDRYKLSKLPDTTGMKNEVIIMRGQRNPYDKAIEVAGAKLVEIGNLAMTNEFELEGVINEKTAAIYFIQAGNYAKAILPLEKVIEIGHKHNVKVIVDAAAQIPPIDNLWKFTEMGADAVAFSGGKAIRGPLNTGFIVGKKEIIDSCKICGFPNRGVGRGGKLSREDMVALYIALNNLLKMSNEEYDAVLRLRCKKLIDGISDIDLFNIDIEEMGPVGQIYPRVEISLNTEKFTVEDIVKFLKEDEPGILAGLPLQKPYDVFYLNPMTLRDDQLDIVISQIKKAVKELDK